MGTETLSSTPTTRTGPEVTDDEIVFRFPDPDGELAQVRLYQEIRRPRNGPDLDYDSEAGTWIHRFPRPDADRMEYLFEIVHKDGSSELLQDPNNEVHSPGAFGDKSVVEFPGYAEPSWLHADAAPDGHETTFGLRCRPVKDQLPTILWSPPGADPEEPLPLLIVHDGPEYAKIAGLTVFFDRGLAAGSLPRFRAALVGPVDRDQIYSASASYARSLTHEIIPALLERAPTPPGRNMRIGMGASLGALAMLHVHRRSPASFGALFIQSGSFFRMRFDKQESGFVRFKRISRFVGEVLTAEEWAHPIKVTMTCGTIEENLKNNRAVEQALRRQGYDARLTANRDGHNWVGWRDTFDPHLTELLNGMWR